MIDRRIALFPGAMGPRNESGHARLKKFWHLIEFFLAGIARGVMERAPVGMTLAFADALGWLVFYARPSRARIAVDNILAAKVADDEAPARRLARRCFQSFTRMVAESIVAQSRVRPENWRDYVTLDASPEALAMLNDPRQGAVVASGHLGNWEVAARAVSMIRPVSVIYRPFNNPHLNRKIHRERERAGGNLHLISKYKASPLRFVKVLADGDWLALMIDQHISEPGQRVRVKFFGRPCWATRSVAMMHLSTRMPLFVALAARVGPMRFRVHLRGPMRWSGTGDRERDVLDITQSLTDEIERLARRYPEQYLWGHRRWKE